MQQNYKDNKSFHMSLLYITMSCHWYH